MQGAVLRPFRADALLILLPGATRFALAPGYHIPRLWRFYACPLAITFGAFGAFTLAPWLSYSAPLALRACWLSYSAPLALLRLPLAITLGAFGALQLWCVDQFENHSFLVVLASA